ncbi:MAG: hypothetical protein ABIZ91_04915 [Gemmatimonadaceae bacterium]
MAYSATTRIESLAAGGAGVARVDGLVVFVPRTAPGDLAEITFVKRQRLGQGRLVRVVESSELRVPPRCGHYLPDACGGCQLQHVEYAAQLTAKQQIIRDAFSRIARRPVEVPAVTPSPASWEYRNKLTLAMRREDDGWVMGLHRWDDVDRIFQLEECPITDPGVLAGWRDIMAAADVLPEAEALRGSVRLLGNTMAFAVEGGSAWLGMREFVRRCPSLGVIRWTDAAGALHVVVDHAEGERPAASFEQVNPRVAEALHASVVLHVMAFAPATVVDGYSGAGEVALALAARRVRVTAIELDREAATHAARALAPPSIAVCGRVEELLPRALPADVVILNPPRTGVDAAVCATLERSPPLAIVYVSCNPATLARDVTRLPAFRVESVLPFDMFPQTTHVETVCVLVPQES